MSDRHILVGVAWPYANGLSHLGHIAGAYLPADIFARYHRTAGHRVLMVSGSDSHGTPITVEAERTGVDPADVVARYHPRFLEQWERLGIQWELFTSTMTENHYAVTQDMFARLVDNGYFEKRTSQQHYDPELERFLPDRYVRGTCPHCGFGDARGDQCDNCGRALDPTDLVDPRSALSGATPVLRDTEHWYLLLSKLQDRVRAWLAPKQGWRPHVKNYALGLIDGDGLLDRAMTRDLDWGVPLPPGYELAAGKRIYVWFDAVIGYLSAAKEWAQIQGDPDAWRAWWQDPDAESYYFVGKDNIWFHALFWPAMLVGYGGLDLPTNVPANQYVTFKGEKASKSRGIGRPVLEWLDDVQADSLRYAVAANLPEQNDTDLDRQNMERRINDELVATWGNLVNRVFSMVGRNFAGTVPEPGELDDTDRAVIEAVDTALAETGASIERVELKAALQIAMNAARDVNGYLSTREPWKTAGSDPIRTATTLRVALDLIDGVNVALSPFLPFSAEEINGWLGHDVTVTEHGWRRLPLVTGATLGAARPLFAKVDLVGDDSA
jgi:methionyl-tRNA synthetase